MLIKDTSNPQYFAILKNIATYQHNLNPIVKKAINDFLNMVSRNSIFKINFVDEVNNLLNIIKLNTIIDRDSTNKNDNELCIMNDIYNYNRYKNKASFLALFFYKPYRK